MDQAEGEKITDKDHLLFPGTYGIFIEIDYVSGHKRNLSKFQD